MTAPTIFEVRPHRGGWQCLEAPGVQPYWIEVNAKRSAIDYAKSRTAHRCSEIRVFGAAGAIEQVIPFDKRSERQRV